MSSRPLPIVHPRLAQLEREAQEVLGCWGPTFRADALRVASVLAECRRTGDPSLVDAAAEMLRDVRRGILPVAQCAEALRRAGGSQEARRMRARFEAMRMLNVYQPSDLEEMTQRAARLGGGGGGPSAMVDALADALLGCSYGRR